MSTRQSTLNLDGTLGVSAKTEVAGEMSLDREPTEAEVRWGITSEELERRRKESPKPTTSRERRCVRCGNRVTKTEVGFEAGHATGRKSDVKCPEYPDWIPDITLDSYIDG